MRRWELGLGVGSTTSISLTRSGFPEGVQKRASDVAASRADSVLNFVGRPFPLPPTRRLLEPLPAGR